MRSLYSALKLRRLALGTISGSGVIIGEWPFSDPLLLTMTAACVTSSCLLRCIVQQIRRRSCLTHHRHKGKLRSGKAIANQNTLIYVLINLRALLRLRQRTAS